MLKVLQKAIHFWTIAPWTVSDAQGQLSMASWTCVVVSLPLSYSSGTFLFFLGSGIWHASDVNPSVAVQVRVSLLKPDLYHCFPNGLVLYAAHFAIRVLCIGPVHDSIDECAGLTAPLILIQRTFFLCRLFSHYFFWIHMNTARLVWVRNSLDIVSRLHASITKAGCGSSLVAFSRLFENLTITEVARFAHRRDLANGLCHVVHQATFSGLMRVYRVWGLWSD